MWFNFDAGICDQPKNVYCTLDTEPPNANAHAEQDEENVSCSFTNDLPAVKFIPSKIDCGRYYICYHGQAIKQHCIDNLHWNAADNKCDQPSNAHCQVNKMNKIGMFDETNNIISFLCSIFRCQAIQRSNNQRFAMEALYNFRPIQVNVNILFSVKMELPPYNNVHSITIGIF